MKDTETPTSEVERLDRDYRIPSFWGVHAVPGKKFGRFLSLLPFVALVIVYSLLSQARHRENPNDKLLPTFTQMGAAIKRMAFTEDVRTGKRLLWADTFASVRRMAFGISIAALIGLFLGMNMGLFRGMDAGLYSVATFAAIVPPLALLPILFVVFGLGELAKVTLIVIGVAPVITHSIRKSVLELPREQLTKSLTMGASQLGYVYRIILPQVKPRLIDAIRLSLGASWLFLIAAEGLASTEGLGYRIFLVRRYMAMDVIIPYVLWITLIGFTVDMSLKYFSRWRHAWYWLAEK